MKIETAKRFNIAARGSTLPPGNMPVLRLLTLLLRSLLEQDAMCGGQIFRRNLDHFAIVGH